MNMFILSRNDRGKVGEMNTLLAIETLTQAGILTVVRADELSSASSVVGRSLRGRSAVALKSLPRTSSLDQLGLSEPGFIRQMAMRSRQRAKRALYIILVCKAIALRLRFQRMNFKE